MARVGRKVLTRIDGNGMVLYNDLARFGLGYRALLESELRLGLGYHCSCVRHLEWF